MEKSFIKGKNIFFHQFALPKKLIELIVEEYADNIDCRPLIPGKIVGNPKSEEENNIINFNQRKCELEWIPQTEWLGPLLWYHVSGINNQFFKYDILNIESIQLTSYSENEFYNWHVDSYHDDRDIERKLTCVIQLSDPNDYDGGDLQILHPGYKGIEIAPKEKGTLIVFDSRLAHRVKPIKSGKRISAVAWAIGPKWR